ncbi:branched-chain amino acid transport system ATP-binding protein [Parafrankia irregularis]|uniref:Branched-chain amino acid transport system ATP-binding protein n=1 Tax=Parafrankia irregularis TaxID=795642 RepID=A0A0S4QIT6_9ACTN|nr:MULTISPECIES: ABC transporter ATP-binding protein [Parafrankia]MBE3205644.1 ABC transporter ATP-binding protein [Parafrankia sp. CH37]CUU55456.1 branched-chain amino acid transport system ATP-binding protein [Parafrankia irregularis]
MLTLHEVTAGYGDTTVLRDVNLTVGDGEVVALLGPNGAGKTTLLRAATGFLRPRSGRVSLDGKDMTAEPAHRYARRGVCHLPEGRGIFPSLTVRENIAIQARGRDVEKSAAEVVDLFPALGTRLRQAAGSLSGGEQQMLALSRAYITSPRLVVVDEASLGLSPRVTDTIYELLARLAERGVSLVVVEQYVQRALALARTVYILNHGAVIHVGRANDITADDIYEKYLGIGH